MVQFRDSGKSSRNNTEKVCKNNLRRINSRNPVNTTRKSFTEKLKGRDYGKNLRRKSMINSERLLWSNTERSLPRAEKERRNPGRNSSRKIVINPLKALLKFPETTSVETMGEIPRKSSVDLRNFQKEHLKESRRNPEHSSGFRNYAISGLNSERHSNGALRMNPG